MRRGKNSFNALAKLGKKLTPDQRKQLGANMGNIFGVNPQGLGSINAMQEAYGAQNPMQQGQSAAAVQQMLQQMGIGQGPGGIQPPGVNPPPPPPGGPGINPPGTGDPPAWGDPSGPGPAPQPPDRDAVGMPIGGGAATGAAGQTPIRVSDPGTFFGGQQGGIGNLQGAMGMGGQVTPPTLAQTVAGQQPAAPTTGGLPAVPGAGGATGAGATATGAGGSPTGVGNSPTGVGNPAPASTGASSANTSPTIGTPAPAGGATSNSLINTGALSAPGVGLGEVQNTVANSPVLGNNPVTDQQMFQQTYNPMINMAGQTDIQNQMGGTPGRSMVGGQYGEGGLMGIAMQQQANQAALQGGTAAQQGIQANLQQQLQGQQVMAGMDASGRQQAVQQANAILGPALSGAATGFGQGLGGMTRMPQFIG